MSAVFLSCLMCCSGTSEGKWDIPDVTPPDVVPPDGGDETPPAEDEYVTVKNGRMYAPENAVSRRRKQLSRMLRTKIWKK